MGDIKQHRVLKSPTEVAQDNTLVKLRLMELALNKALRHYKYEQRSYHFLYKIIKLLPLILSIAVVILLANDPLGVQRKIALGLAAFSTVSNTIFTLINFKVLSKELKMAREQFLLLKVEVVALKDRAKKGEAFSSKIVDDLKDRYFDINAKTLAHTLECIVVKLYFRICYNITYDLSNIFSSQSTIAPIRMDGQA